MLAWTHQVNEHAQLLTLQRASGDTGVTGIRHSFPGNLSASRPQSTNLSVHVMTPPDLQTGDDRPTFQRSTPIYGDPPAGTFGIEPRMPIPSHAFSRAAFATTKPAVRKALLRTGLFSQKLVESQELLFLAAESWWCWPSAFAWIPVRPCRILLFVNHILICSLFNPVSCMSSCFSRSVGYGLDW